MEIPNPSQSRTTRLHDISHFEKAAVCRLFLNEHGSDVSFRIEWDGKSCRFPAHRQVLSSVSNVFRMIFNTTDIQQKKTCEIKITDSNPVTVKHFLRYIYMGTMSFTSWQEAADLMKLAHKYSVTTLVTLCEAYLTSALTISNACYLYEIAKTYSLINLEKHASNWILSAAFIVTTTYGFLNLKSRSLKFFLKSSSLNMENECCVLTTLREWAVESCSRRGLALTRVNILEAMEPFTKYIHWDLIPEQLRTFVPDDMIVRHENRTRRRRKAFHVAHLLQTRASCLKFYVDLGAYYADQTSDARGLNLVKFCVDNYAFVVGFRIIGLFKEDATALNTVLSNLTLTRDDNVCSVFNLNSLPWTKGAAVGDYVWQELTAYLPYPVRVDPFRTYMMILKYDSRLKSAVMWPFTRLESGVVNSSVRTMNFLCYSNCYGITRLFVWPASPPRNVCNAS